jgi:hypothetical protein
MNTKKITKMIITWYTQPEGKFASFYYYDTITRILVRIRLELKRDDGDGAKVIYRNNRYCGFSKIEELLKTKTLSVANGFIKVSDGTFLTDKPEVGYYVYDFSSKDGLKPDNNPHHGNAVTLKPVLPKGITEVQLKLLAIKSIALKKSISLVNSDASTEQLIEAILNNIK